MKRFWQFNKKTFIAKQPRNVESRWKAQFKGNIKVVSQNDYIILTFGYSSF